MMLRVENYEYWVCEKTRLVHLIDKRARWVGCWWIWNSERGTSAHAWLGWIGGVCSLVSGRR